jgi:hypothetical protein
MTPVDQLPLDGVEAVSFAKDQDEFETLPALLYPDGTVLTEWSFSEEERAAIARGENLRLWIVKGLTHRCPNCQHHAPALLTPLKLELTHEQVA